MIKLNELLAVINEEKCTIAFKHNNRICYKYTIYGKHSYLWGRIYNNSDLFDVISVYTEPYGMITALVIEVE